MDIHQLSQRAKVAIVVALLGLVLAIVAFGMSGAGFIPLIDFYANSVFVAEKEGFNAIPAGNGITITAVEGTNRVDYTFTVTATSTNSFETWVIPEGTNLVADSSSDTIQFLASGLQILGNSSSDSITFTVTGSNSFSIVDTPEGTNPNSNAPEQVLTLLANGLSISGDSATNSVTFTVTSTGTSLDIQENGSGTVTGATVINFFDPFDVVVNGTQADILFDSTEINTRVWGDNTVAGFTWIFDPPGALNPFFSFDNSSLTIGNTSNFQIPSLGDCDFVATDATAALECVSLIGGRSITASGLTIDADLELFTDKKSIVITSPVTGSHTNLVQFEYSTAATITEISCSTDSGTITIQFDERARATPNTPGTDVMTSVLVCDTDSQTTTAFDNAAIAADVPVNLQLTASTGTPGVVRIHVESTKDD